MKTTKPLIKSKTFHGSVAVLLSVAIYFIFDVEVSDADILNAIVLISSAVGAVYSIYGRIVAKDEIDSIL